MKLYRDMNDREREVADRAWAFALQMQKRKSENRMELWDSMTKEEREKIRESEF